MFLQQGCKRKQVPATEAGLSVVAILFSPLLSEFVFLSVKKHHWTSEKTAAEDLRNITFSFPSESIGNALQEEFSSGFPVTDSKQLLRMVI